MSSSSIVALSGGVGGAKLSLGLLRSLPADSLKVIVNTGDDFTHLGLRIAPDLDTTLYTLAGLVNPTTGWGRRDETWTFMAAMEALGGETWFRLGDGDLALHVERTRRLATGESLSQVTADFARRLGVAASIVPMTDDVVATLVSTDAGDLAFQDYFVRRQCQPRVITMRYAGAEHARPAEAATRALTDASTSAIIICPSNPYLSIAPILAVPDLDRLLRETKAPVVAVSPLIGNQAIKGPTAKIMAELNLPVSSLEIARRYEGLIDGLILDVEDRDLAACLDIPVLVTNTLMNTMEDRERLARSTLEFANSLTPAKRR